MSQSWVWKRLGDVCTLQRGFDLPKQSRSNGAYPLVSSSGITDFHSEAKVKGAGVVTGRSGSIGAVFYIEEDFWPLNTVLYVKDFHHNHEKFIYYLLQNFDLAKFSSGTGVPTLNRNHVHDELVYIPLALEEQKRIVAILDEAFAGISQAIDNTEKNLANARELFESYVNTVFLKQNGGLKGDLNSFCNLIATGPFGSMLHKSDYVTEGVPLVNPINIVNGEIIPDSSKLISEETKKKLDRYVLKKNDLVIGRRGEIGRCAVIRENQDGWVCGTGCFFIRPKPLLNSNFLAHLLRSDYYSSLLEAAATGATMKNLSNQTLSNLVINIPSIEGQLKILDELNSLGEHKNNLQDNYQQKLQSLAELKQSLLQKAFSGELTANNVDKWVNL